MPGIRPGLQIGYAGMLIQQPKNCSSSYNTLPLDCDACRHGIPEEDSPKKCSPKDKDKDV